MASKGFVLPKRSQHGLGSHETGPCPPTLLYSAALVLVPAPWLPYGPRCSLRITIPALKCK